MCAIKENLSWYQAGYWHNLQFSLRYLPVSHDFPWMVKTIFLTYGPGFIASYVNPRSQKTTRFQQGAILSHILRVQGECCCATRLSCDWRRKVKSKIVVLDRLDYCASLKNLKGARYFLSVEFIKDDIRSTHLLNHIFASECIDTVLPFATQSHVDNSFRTSFEFTKNYI